MKKIALCYDFDGTLCSGYMQNQKLIPDCKIDVGKFWTEVIKNSKKNNLLKKGFLWDLDHYLLKV